MFRLSISQHSERLPLWLMLLFSLIGFSLFPFCFPLIPYYNHYPLADIRSFTPSLLGGLGYASLLGVLFVLYGLTVHRVQTIKQVIRPWHILLITCLFSLPLLFTYPINATDIYRYFIRGRVSSVYRQSPFTTPPDTFKEDPYLLLAGEWSSETSPYGPLWEMAAAAVTSLAPDNLLLGLLIFKSFGLILHLALGILLYLWQKERIPSTNAPPHAQQPIPDAFLWWLWNPALLLTFVVDAHNDIFMLLWLVLGALLLRHGRFIIGFLIMILAPLTKPIALLALPFFWLNAWQQQPRSHAVRFFFASIGGSLTLVWLAFRPFGSPVALVVRLLREAADIGGFSPITLLILIARALGSTMPIATVTNLGLGLFVLAGLWLAWRAWNGRSPLHSTADAFLAYIFTAFSFRIWYTTWAFPWLLLDTPQRQRLGHGLLLTAQFSVLVYGHLRVYMLGGNQTMAHLIGVPLTFALPLCILLYSCYHSQL